VTPSPRRAPRDWSRYAVGLAFLTILGPFLVAASPPLTDYPNHLARFWLIAGGAADPRLAGFYAVDWSSASTNVGVDWAVAWASSWVSATTLGHAAAIAAAALPPLGLLALNTALFRRPTAWQSVFPIAAWSVTFLMGFLNFQVGLGLALLFAAVDPLVQPRLARSRWRWAAAAARAPLGLILAADHLFALLSYAVLLAALAFGAEPIAVGPGRPAWWPLGRPLVRPLVRRLIRGALAAAWCLPLVLVLAVLAPALPAVATPGTGFGAFTGKLELLISPLVGYNILVELPLALALAALVLWIASRGALEGHRGLLVAASALMVLAVVTPHDVGDSSWMDTRLPIMALLCLAAGVRLSPAAPARTARDFALAALALVSLRAAWVGWNWREMAPNDLAVRRALADLPVGARLLPLQHRPSLGGRFSAPAGRYMFNVADETFRHLPLVAIPLRRAFVPSLFALHGKQPVQVRARWLPCAEPGGGVLASVSALSRAPRVHDPKYLASWRGCFDYILVLNADLPDETGPFRPPPGVERVSDQGFAQLWRIRPD
jgi:hypothetical protein